MKLGVSFNLGFIYDYILLMHSLNFPKGNHLIVEQGKYRLNLFRTKIKLLKAIKTEIKCKC